MRAKVSVPAVRAHIEQELGTWLRQVNTELSGYEQLQMFVIAKEPWTIENGMLTPTMKIKRAKIEAAIAKQLDAWYAAKGPVVWA
jgi:long-subunit acyl-CoA synthetase (AMP-forming)